MRVWCSFVGAGGSGVISAVLVWYPTIGSGHTRDMVASYDHTYKGSGWQAERE
jgi:hypothetical protein